MLSGVFSIQEKSILFEIRLVSLITKFVSPNTDPDFGRSWIPNNFEKLKELPGIGDYTANILLALIYNQPRIGLDSNVKRVLSRVFKTDSWWRNKGTYEYK